MDGKKINGLPSHKVAQQGLVRTFQNVRLFKNLTVLENLLVAQHTHIETRLLPGLFKVPSFRRSEQEAQKNAVDWLDFMGIRQLDRKSVVSGKRVSVRVDLGGRRNIKKKKNTQTTKT